MNTPSHPDGRQADTMLSRRDSELPALPWVLDNDLLSSLAGEPVRITRVRYKPGTSALSAFTLERHGETEYGWAMTRSAGSASKLQHRKARSDAYHGGIRLLYPDPGNPEAVVALGGIEDDWPLRANLLWLRSRGLDRLGAQPGTTGQGLTDQPASILRYKPERRLVLRLTGARPLVVKTAALPYDAAARRRMLEHLENGGVPVLSELADAPCASHGISASPVWGESDLTAGNNDVAAQLAGEALAALHGTAHTLPEDPASVVRQMIRQLIATQAMINTLLPGLDEPVARLTGCLLDLAARGQRNYPRVLLHGDFSPDQILVSGTSVRIIDFDRVRTGESASDIGSFGAVEQIPCRGTSGPTAFGEQTERLIQGYRESGGQVLPARVAVWAAYRLFLGSVDPFRDRAACWPEETEWHIRRGLEMIP